MEILQRNIVGGMEAVSSRKTDKTSEKKPIAKKPFPEINLSSGLNEKEAEGNAMLIQRSLQKKLMFSNLKNKGAFLNIIENEMGIKTGDIDVVTATRDSLVSFFAKPRG